MLDNKTISKLIIESQNGNEESFNELYKNTSLILINQVKEILNDYESVLDIVQDTYLKMLQSKLKNDENGLSYLITIARNLAINMYNKRKKEISIDNVDYDNFLDVDEIKKHEIDIQKLMKDKLTPYQIELINLHIMYGLKHVEIALKLNKPVGTIMWQYNEAIKVLRKNLL